MTNRVEAQRPFTSQLVEPRGRFLAAVVEHALTVGRRKPADFIRSFGPRDIMRALANQPALRATILVSTTGVNEKIATRKTAESAGEDLEIALHEGVTNDAAIVSLVEPDDRVRYLENPRLWAFLTEGEFWKNPDAGSIDTVRSHVSFILERARAEKLLSDREIVEGIGLETLVSSLPKQDVVLLLQAALVDGRGGKPFKDERVLEILAPVHLLDYVDIAHVWERVVAPKLGYAPEALTRPPTALVAEAADDAPVLSINSPSLDVTVEEGDALVEEEESDAARLDVEAMLARTRASDPPDAHVSASADDEIRSGLTSRPPR